MADQDKVQQPPGEQNRRSDDILPPEHVDPGRVRRLIALRRHLNIKMDDMAKLCSIPLSEYRHMENGKLFESIKLSQLDE